MYVLSNLSIVLFFCFFLSSFGIKNDLNCHMCRHEETRKSYSYQFGCFHQGPRHYHPGPDLISCLRMFSQLLHWPFCLVSTQSKVLNLQALVKNKNAEHFVQKAGNNYHWRCENVFVFLSSTVSFFQLRMMFFICYLISRFWENRDTCCMSTGTHSSKGPEEETFMKPIKAPQARLKNADSYVLENGERQEQKDTEEGRGEGGRRVCWLM